MRKKKKEKIHMVVISDLPVSLAVVIVQQRRWCTLCGGCPAHLQARWFGLKSGWHTTHWSRNDRDSNLAGNLIFPALWSYPLARGKYWMCERHAIH
eukprot:5741482-Amphidinium_carterae.1